MLARLGNLLRSEKQRAAVLISSVAAIVACGVATERAGRAENVTWIPASGDEVVERLPKRAQLGRDVAGLRAAARAAPNDPARATALAERLVREARASGDPRLLGQARAVLATWWTNDDAAPRIVLLRAIIKQSLHDFDGALVDLDHLERTGDADVQSALTRAVVLTVTGRYDAARAACGHVRVPLARAVCSAQVDSVTGNAKAAYAKLAAAIDMAAADERAWALSTLGEVAVRAGDDAAAERHFRAALALDPEDRYTIGAYADLLLDTARASEVTAIVGDRRDDDGLLLRVAIAEGAPADLAQLRERRAAAHARGDVVHRREEARLALVLEHDAPSALALARANFAVQKEPWDVRLVLEAAIAAGDHAAAREALAFFETSGLEEPRLRALAAKVKR